VKRKVAVREAPKGGKRLTSRSVSDLKGAKGGGCEKKRVMKLVSSGWERIFEGRESG